jgi:predicted metal-dependent hydrolase
VIRFLRQIFKQKQVRKRNSLPSPRGNHYDLQAIFQEVNQEYFEGRLSLPIRWSGNAAKAARYRRRLGSYHLGTGEIRVHRLLDSPQFPPYFISYIVYHEMLHHLHPPEQGRRGRRRIHHATFKEKERQFKHYDQVKAWEKENIKEIFYGRT